MILRSHRVQITKWKKKYLHTLSSDGFEQIIKDITRVGRNSTGEKTETIIDHILCNDTSKVCQSGVVPFELSDHYLISALERVLSILFQLTTLLILEVWKIMMWKHSATFLMIVTGPQSWVLIVSILPGMNLELLWLTLLTEWHQEKLLGLSSVLNLGCPPL